MAIVETSGVDVTVVLNLNRATTLLVIPSGEKPQIRDSKRRSPLEVPLISPLAVLPAVQDYLTFGADDCDNRGSLTRLIEAVRQLPNPDIESIYADLANTLAETGIEGKRMGERALVLTEVHSFLVTTIEEALTAPER